MQVKGANYLIPVGAAINSEEEVEYESIEAGLVLAQMESAKNGMNIVILDACRNNPFARSFRSAEKGLASIDAPSGTFLAYSTAPGSVASDGAGRNGLYTQELLKQIKVPGLSIEEVFKRVRISVRGATAEKQTPWEVSSLVGNFYFDGTAPKNQEASQNQSSSPLKFSWEYKGEPEPGKRIWYQFDAVTWIERYQSGFESVFTVVGRTDIDGDRGFIVRKVAGDSNKTLVTDSTFEVFIPDPSSKQMWLRFRHFADGKWQVWNYMGEIAYNK